MGSPAQRSKSGSPRALQSPRGHVNAKSPAWHRRHLPPAPPAPKCSSARHRASSAAVNTNTHTQEGSKNNLAPHSDASSLSPGELCLSHSPGGPESPER